MSQEQLKELFTAIDYDEQKRSYSIEVPEDVRIRSCLTIPNIF